MSLVGVLLALASIITANIIEGGNPLALIDVPAFFIVLGSTFGACVVQFPLKTLIGSMKQMKWMIAPPKPDYAAQVETLENMTSIARQQGLLALENQIPGITDQLTQSGLQMIVDGVDKEQLVDLLEKQISTEEFELEQNAKVFEAFGGYAPCMGIVGAVLGLIHAMGLLDQPELLGPSIGVAFTATIYGVVSANTIFLPMGNRCKRCNHELLKFKEMTMEGLISIASGENTMQLKRRLEPYLPPEMLGEKK
ncbi:MAG: flagellar motor protein [Succinivibrionaceae bacterium]|nr:flagellar motor protein [Succinivibrionaceae bacterium]